MSHMNAIRSEDPGVAGAEVSGPLRLETSPRALVKRLRPGDIAVLDVMDLDSRTAEELVEAAPAAVVNVQKTLSGRYPAGGAAVLASAGIPVVDEVGSAVMSVPDGAVATIRPDGAIVVDGEEAARGTVLTADAIGEEMASAEDGLHVQLAAFAADAVDRVESEAPLLLESK